MFVESIVSEKCFRSFDTIVQRAKNLIDARNAGWMVLSFILVMTGMALRPISSRNFPAFFRVHIILAVCVLGGALLHGVGSALWRGKVLRSIPGLWFWALDVFIRICSMNCAPS